MSNQAERRAEDAYEAQNDATGGDVPSGVPNDSSYNTGAGARSAGGPIAVQSDSAPVEDGVPDGPIANSDAYLQQDEKEAIDESNILKGGRTRGATKPAGTYQEPGDEEGLPSGDDGTSAVR